MVQSKKQGKYMAVFNAVLCVFCICMCGSRNFHQVGGGEGGVEGPGPPDSKKLGQRCFVIFVVFYSSPSTYLTVLQRGPIPGSDGLFFGKQ